MVDVVDVVVDVVGKLDQLLITVSKYVENSMNKHCF